MKYARKKQSDPTTEQWTKMKKTKQTGSRAEKPTKAKEADQIRGCKRQREGEKGMESSSDTL